MFDKRAGSVSKLSVGSLALVPDRPYPVIETVIGLGPVRMPARWENVEIWSGRSSPAPGYLETWGRKAVLFLSP